MRSRLGCCALLVALCGCIFCGPTQAGTTRPNVILIMTDDQGIGDFGATGNRVTDNTLINNGTNPDPGTGFEFAAADMGLLAFGNYGDNCWQDNVFTTFFKLLAGDPPTCDPPPAPPAPPES